MKPRIIIEVSGGLVQEVTSSEPVEVRLIDWDNIKQGDKGTGLFPVRLLNDAPFNTRLADIRKEIDEYNRR